MSSQSRDSNIAVRASQDRALRVGVVALWLVVATAFNFTLGLFEGHDELPHFRAVDRIAQERTLPRLNAATIAYSHELTQPPLYYALVALVIGPLDRSDLAEEAFLNPRPNDALGYDHTRDELRWPPDGAILALRVAREVSVVLGAASLLLIGAAATLLTGSSRAGTLAMALGGFNPKFLHVFSVVSNDVAVYFFAALFLWAALRAARYAQSPRASELAGIGAIVALAMLSKYNGLALAFPAAIVALAPIAQRQVPIKRGALNLAALGAGFLVVVGPFFLYNQIAYGHPLALEQVTVANAGSARPIPLDPTAVLATLPPQIATYYELIAHGLIPPAGPRWVAAAVFVIGTLSFAARMTRPRPTLAQWVCVATAAAGLAGWVAWFARYDQTGNIRLSGVAFPALALISGAGAAFLLAPWLDKLRWRAGYWVSLALMAALAASTVWQTILPSYDIRPSRVPAAVLRRLPQGGAVRFDKGIEIVSVDIERNKIDSGEEARLTFYWRLVDWQLRAQQFVLEAINERGDTVARLATNPQPGLNTTTWGVRTVYSATHALALTSTVDTIVKLYAGFYDYEPPHAVARVTSDGSASALVGQVKVRSARASEVAVPNRIDASFGDGLRLEGFEVVSDTLSLFWRANREMATNPVIFTHALDAQGKIIGQVDAPAAYAMTLWDAGEQARETRRVPGLAGAAALRVGVYDADARRRLPAQSSTGAALPDDAVVIPLAPRAP